MSRINEGGPAFPQPDGKEQLESPYLVQGMSLRDYFAAKAIPEASRLEHEHPCGPLGVPTYEGIATRAFLLADAMLRARQS